jgi:hypothetical protein
MAKLNFTAVYSTLKQDEMAIIKSLLDAAKIQYYIRNETPYRSAADASLMDIMVVSDKVEEVKGLLKEFISPNKT